MDQIFFESHDKIENFFPFIFHTDISTSCHYSPNWHTNMEFLCCISGHGIVKCGTTEYDFSPGDILVINANTLHAIISNTKVVYHCLIVDNSFFRKNDVDINTFFFQEHIQDPNIFSAFSKVAETFSSQSTLRNAAINHAVLGLFLLLCSKYTIQRPVSDQIAFGTERVKNILHYINENISSCLTLENIAASVGVSKYYLCHEFKKNTGYTVFEIIIMTRCRQAKYLIQNGNSVSTAARSCGFENMSYFTRTYKKYMGRVPSEDAIP